MTARRIDRAHDVPAFAGSSNDGRTIYIDRHVPHEAELHRRSGKGTIVIDPAIPLAEHESVENHHMTDSEDMPYETAHRIALKAERKVVESLGADWNSYQNWVKTRLPAIEREKLTRVPKDLYDKPYEIHSWGRKAQQLKAVQRAEGRKPAKRLDR